MIKVKNDNTQKVLADLKKAIKQSLLESGEVALKTAQEKVPYRTGKLKRSLATKMDGDNKVEIGSYDVAYNVYVEAGTSRRPATPYLRPAIVDNENKIKNIFKNNFS